MWPAAVFPIFQKAWHSCHYHCWLTPGPRDEGPVVTHIGTITPGLIEVIIQEQDVIEKGQVSFENTQKTRLQPSGKKRVVNRGGGLKIDEKNTKVERQQDNGKYEEIGSLAVNAGKLALPDRITGREITDETLEIPAAYRVQSQDDSAYGNAREPVEVYRKSKVTDLANGVKGNPMPVRHHIFLKLPENLKPGASYTVSFPGVNTQEESASFTYDSRANRSTAVRVPQVGYRPDDPFKRGFLSMWLGTGGELEYPDSLTFEIIGAEDGKTYYEGEVERAFAADAQESFKKGRNYSKTNTVRFINFHRRQTSNGA